VLFEDVASVCSLSDYIMFLPISFTTLNFYQRIFQMVKILITSVGSLVGYNILDVLEGRRQDLQIIGTNSIEADANIYRCDKAYLVPSTRHNKVDFLHALLEILDNEQPTLIIPGRDDDLRVLAELRTHKPEFANSCLCGDEKSVGNILDKWLTFKFASRHDLPFAVSAIPNSDSENLEVKQLVNEYGFPLLVKPRDGFGSHGVFVISNEDQLRYALGLEHMVIQQYLSNPKELERLYSKVQNEGIPLFFTLEADKYSLQTFVHRDGTVGEIFCTLHKMVSGRSLKVEKIINGTLEDIALKYAKAMAYEGWFGPINIQCQKQQSGEFRAYELNGRYTGATSARYHLGFDEVGIALNTLLGLRLESNKLRVSKSNQVTRYVTTQPIPDDTMVKFRDQGKWQSANN
jgi:carbamoyl-phosphate synthase large subunit